MKSINHLRKKVTYTNLSNFVSLVEKSYCLLLAICFFFWINDLYQETQCSEKKQNKVPVKLSSPIESYKNKMCTFYQQGAVQSIINPVIKCKKPFILNSQPDYYVMLHLYRYMISHKWAIIDGLMLILHIDWLCFLMQKMPALSPYS